MEIILITLCIIVITLFNYCGYDLYKFAKNRIIDRFFEGRITDNKIWGAKIEKICKKWLLHTPTVRASDKHITLIGLLLKKNRKSSIQVWQKASLLIALESKKNDFSKSKSIKNITDSDYGMLAFALADTQNNLNNEMLEYISKNTTADGIILYKSHARDLAFVDTLGFICPFLVKRGVLDKNEYYINIAKRQIELYLKYGTEENSGLPFHAFNINTHIKLGICDWARGLAWLLIGLMDSYGVLLSENIKDAFFEENIKKYADLIMPLQKSSGGYSWRLLSNFETDSSATAVFGWFLACAANIFNNNNYLESAKKCREFLKSKTRNSGIIDACQGDTMGVGNYSRSFDIMPFAQGFALRLNKELESHN